MTGVRRAAAPVGIGGVAVAGITALISGVSVFVNSYGVHAVPSPAVYTTAKNLVAFAVLGIGTAVAVSRRSSVAPSVESRWVDPPERSSWALGTRGSGRPGMLHWLGLAYVGIVGGGIAFVLFFDGLARTTATPAALDRDSLVIWVALLGIFFLHERLNGWNVGAIALLLAGEAVLSVKSGHLAWSSGDALVMASTGLWAVEVVVARRLLADVAPATISLVRMGVGGVTLVVYLAATGSLAGLTSLGAGAVGWVLLTGLLLAAYVATWMTALARARAVDVTSMLVASVVVTAVLQALAGSASLAPQLGGLVLVGAGTLVVAWRAPERVPA
ncbi:MAG: DMT family transporter [Acidimicrobiales bacterium]